MSKLTLISTIYSLEPVIICVTRLSRGGADGKKLRSEEMIELIFKNALEIEKRYTVVYLPPFLIYKLVIGDGIRTHEILLYQILNPLLLAWLLAVTQRN